MPRGDRTGPFGDGPRTGRGMGFCAGHNVPGFMNRGSGYGPRMGRGGGRGNRRMFYATGVPGWARGKYGDYPEQNFDYVDRSYHNMRERDELRALKAQAETLQQSLESINARIAELSHDNCEKGV